jgi:hypothetical protein
MQFRRAAGCGVGNKNSAQRSNSYQKFVVQIASLSRVCVSSPAPQSERTPPRSDRLDGIAGPQ